MTKEQALHQFWNSFGWIAYEEYSVPPKEEVVFPYITYQVVTGSFDSEFVLVNSLYDNSTSMGYLNVKADEIVKTLGRNGVYLDCDSGTIWIKGGDTVKVSNYLGDSTNPNIKRKLINITVEYLTII